MYVFNMCTHQICMHFSSSISYLFQIPLDIFLSLSQLFHHECTCDKIAFKLGCILLCLFFQFLLIYVPFICIQGVCHGNCDFILYCIKRLLSKSHHKQITCNILSTVRSYNVFNSTCCHFHLLPYTPCNCAKIFPQFVVEPGIVHARLYYL